SAAPTDSAAAAVATHLAPVAIVAHYTTGGATIFWKAPTPADQLANYNIELSVSAGSWKLISTVPASQLSLNVSKVNASGWTSFRVSTVYSDGQIVSGKVFGLPGTWA
ncbi:MAG: hypothetical protein WCO08_08515, partial [Actinomycetes bacterium]